MKSHSGTAIAHRFFAGTGRSYDLIVNLFTLGFDHWWKQRILREIPPNACHIVDQACGTGILTFQIVGRFPNSRVTGVELRNEYLDIAKEKLRRSELENVDFLLGRAEEVRVDAPVDCITSSYLAKYADLDSLIENAKIMLKPGGKLIMHDFTYPAGPVFCCLWKFYFRVMQTVGSVAFPEWKTVFDELPGFLEQTPWIPDLLQALQENGFTQVKADSVTWGAAAIVTATRP